ncbi:MAG: sugar 3,4-ketoisomerase [Ignavibacteria bacterium]
MNFKKSKVFDCNVIELPKDQTTSGNLTALNSNVNLPFEFKRVYYLYDIPGGESRGGHAHKTLQQIIVAASGSFDVLLDDGENRKIVHLNRPYNALHIVPGIWRELMNFSSGAICLVIASDKFKESDYLRKYELFQTIKYK